MNKIILLSLLFFVSCSDSFQVRNAVSEQDDTSSYILINGEYVELVSDEFENIYLKQKIDDEHFIYVPFPFETEEEENLQPIQTKIK